MVQNILSIDVEEIFHAEYCKRSGEDAEYRSAENIPLILDMLKDFEVSVTFFMVGELAEKYPEILRMIKDDGHEVAYHSWSDKPLWEQTEDSFRSELRKFMRLYPSCMGYRAPFFSLDRRSAWALKVLEEEGMKYDSSIFPTKTPLYGVPEAPIKPYRPSKDDLVAEDDEGIWEFPLLVYSFMGIRIPAAGGFYLRLMPSLVKRSIRAMNDKGHPAVIYIHNWELDPGTPRLGLNRYHSFVTYHNIEKTERSLRRLLTNFDFTSFENYLADNKSV